jgi:hypothetical protein
MSRLQQCCCCIDLPSGAKVLGILGIIVDAIYILLVLAGIVFSAVAVESLKGQHNEPDIQAYLNMHQKQMESILLASGIGEFPNQYFF